MATTQVASSTPNAPCDYCHQKPKFANHSFCSKTCATQAAALCDYCHKKPKFQGFNYCGKNCAGKVGPSGSGQAVAGNIANGATYAKPRNNAAPPQQQRLANPAPSAIDPVQIAKLVVQHIPQVAQAFFNSNGAQQNPSGAGAGPAPQVMPPKLHVNPFVGGIPATQQNLDNNGNNQQAADDLRCLIPGCGKPVHFDAKGVKTSDYCSLRHREEAVTSGLRSPCILCLAYPQNDADYFCSRACREESMNKYLDYDDDETVVSSQEVNEV